MNEKIKDLQIDEWIWIIFIAISILNIIGDEYEKDAHIQKDKLKDEKAKKIFTATVFISFLIYLYIFYQRYSFVSIKKRNNEDCHLDELRLFGSALVVIAASIFLYYQLNNTTASNPSIS